VSPARYIRSRSSTRRADLLFGIGYGDDIGKARAVIDDLLVHDRRILGEPAPLIVVSNLGESSVDITVRVWIDSADYWDVRFDVTERVKLAFNAADISIAFPQRDVHRYQAGGRVTSGSAQR
jgi:small conductance mechanosensitive channel